MKKFLTLALALVMALALAAPAMAFSSEVDKELADYAIDLVLVEYEESDDFFYYGVDDDDVIITSLPEADRGYVTNEVVCAKFSITVEKNATPAETDMVLYLTGENVKFNTGSRPVAGTKAAKDGYNGLAFARYLNDDDEFAGWEIDDQDLFEGGSKDVTYEWLGFAKVTDDDASLTLVLEGDITASEGLCVDFKQGDKYEDVVADFAASITPKLNGDEYTIGVYDAAGALLAIQNGWFADTNGSGSFDAGDLVAADVSPEGGVYVISNEVWASAMYIVFDNNYRARAMFIDQVATDLTNPNTDILFVDDDGDVYTTSLAGLPAVGGLLALNGTNAAGTSGAIKANMQPVASGMAPVALSAAAERFLDEICDTLSLDPANVGNILRPSYFDAAGSTGVSQSVTVDIQPWQAYVTIPDIEVIDPPKTGDAATLAGFVMIVLAAAGVVVFKKVRA